MEERTYDDTMFRDTFEHEYTWLNGFRRNVRRFARRTAVIDPETGRSWTYRELDEEANRLAHALQADGTGKNDVVMTVLRNCPEFCFSYIAPRKIGAILMPANFNLACRELALLMEHNRPKVLIYSASVAPLVVQAAGLSSWKPVRLVLADNREGCTVPAGHESYESYTGSRSTDEPRAAFRPHIYDEVLRLCTSGTTALPKSVPINDINEVLSAHDVIMQYPLSARDVTLNMTPWFHRGGCHCGGPCPAFYAGCTLVVMRNFQPKTVLRWVSAYTITFIMGAPANLEMLAHAQELLHCDLGSLKGIVTMGAPLTHESCLRYMNVLSPNIFNGYGTTETFWNSFLRPYDLPHGAGSVGSSCIDDEVRVVRIADGMPGSPDDTVPCDGKTLGEIIIRSPEKTTYTYYHDDETAAKKFTGGWMYTGDTGTWDEDLVVTVCGRKDDMMVVSGENIFPAQVEEAICESPLVKDCIVTSVPDRVRGQAVVAYVVPEGGTITVEYLKDFCAASPLLSTYKRPRYFALIDTIPCTATGKKIHSAIRTKAAEDLAAGRLRRL